MSFLNVTGQTWINTVIMMGKAHTGIAQGRPANLPMVHPG
jgi:hypothetical protein